MVVEITLTAGQISANTNVSLISGTPGKEFRVLSLSADASNLSTAFDDLGYNPGIIGGLDSTNTPFQMLTIDFPQVSNVFAQAINQPSAPVITPGNLKGKDLMLLGALNTISGGIGSIKFTIIYDLV
jgi:hypothetical protein